MTQWYPKIAEYDYDGWAAFDYIGREFHAPFSDFDVTIKIDKNYVLGAGGTLENPTEVKGYTAASNVKADRMVKQHGNGQQKYSGFCMGSRQRLFC
jgi:hypothetical protein